MRRLVEEGRNARPLLLVVDYAKSRRSDVSWLCERLLKRRDSDGSPARLVLLSRWAANALAVSEGQWWRSLYRNTDVQKIFGKGVGGKADIIHLGQASASLAVEQRLELFNRSIEAFKEILAQAGRSLPDTPPTQTQIERIILGTDYNRPLAVQLEALLHLYGQAPGDARVGIDTLLHLALELEKHNWTKRLTLGDDNVRFRRVERGVCRTTLVTHVDTKKDACSLLRTQETYSDEAIELLHDDLHVLYGTQNGGLLPLEPDLIGEHLIAENEDKKVVDGCFDWAAGDSTKRQAILTVLNRASRDEHGQLGDNASDEMRRLFRSRGTNLEIMLDFIEVAKGTPGKLRQILDHEKSNMSSEQRDLFYGSFGGSAIEDPQPLIERAKIRQIRDTGSVRDEATITGATIAGGISNFFISRAGKDKHLAQRIASILRDAGHQVFLQDDDFGHASFLARFEQEFSSGARVIALLSNAYLESDYCKKEYSSVLSSDPLNRLGRLVLLRIEDCAPSGMLGSLPYLDLVPLLVANGEFEPLLSRAVVHFSASMNQPAPPDLARFFSKPPRRVPPRLIHTEVQDSKRFIGRHKELHAILELLQAPRLGVSNASVIALNGLGGVGKTALARAYAWQNRDQYRGVWWIRAESRQVLLEDLAELGRYWINDLELQFDVEKTARLALKLIEEEHSQPWLLIYDDVQTPSEISQWTPSTGAHIIITSRWQEWFGSAQDLKVGTFSREVAIDFLMQAARGASRDPEAIRAAAGRLADALGCLPLALSIARSHAWGMNWSFDQYLACFGPAFADNHECRSSPFCSSNL